MIEASTDSSSKPSKPLTIPICLTLPLSQQNRERLLLDKLNENMRMEKDKVIQDLAPSGKNEAFSTLVNKMVSEKLLIEEDNWLQLPHWLAPPDYYKRLTPDQLREQYELLITTTRKEYLDQLRKENDPKRRSLLSEFVELHSYQISFRITWDNSRENWWKEIKSIYKKLATSLQVQ